MAEWEYSWKSSDGVRHESVMEAASKDEVYTRLKADGIRAIHVTQRVVVKGGIRSLRKRDWTVIAAILVLTAIASCYFTRSVPTPPAPAAKDPGKTVRKSAGVESDVVMVRRLRSIPRRQMAERPVASNVFSHVSEVYLAAFAVPGDVRNLPRLTDEVSSDFFDAFDDEITVEASDPKPVAELKRSVIGLKQEAEAFLESGKSAAELSACLISRQRMEAAYREQLLNDVKKGVLSDADADAVLHQAGLRGVK